MVTSQLDHEQFIKAICDKPDDDLPRLIYSDWLEENDQIERAEYIRDGIVMSQYTDCPTRLSDLKTGRPIPLRCGQCDYCRARRRIEAKKPIWIDQPHSYSLEFGPFDHELAINNGIHLTIYRGFVSGLRCSLLQFTGTFCSLCDGQGGWWGGIAESWQDIVDTEETTCPDCRGSGRTDAMLDVLFATQPVTNVVLVDRNPHRTAVRHGGERDEWGWCDIGEYTPLGAENQLPTEIYELLDGHEPQTETIRWKFYPTRTAALTAISRACVGYGRKRANPERKLP